MTHPGWALLGLLSAGCSDELPLPPLDIPTEPASAEVEPAPVEPAPTYIVERVEHGGAVHGAVRWRGLRPRLPAIAVPRRETVCGREQPATALLIGPGAGIANAVVTVDVASGLSRAVPDEPEVMEQRGCRFVPHVVVVGRGQPLVFRNANPVLHNVDARFEDGARWFDVGLPREGQTSAFTADRAGVARVVCDAGHPWESGFVHVVEHPYIAVTGPDGTFRIEGIPPGEHAVRVWHEGFEPVGSESGRPVYSEPVVLERAVEVTADGDVELELTLGPSAG